MHVFFKSDKFAISLLCVFFFAMLCFFYRQQGIFLIDTGRELYLPSEILNGNVLYKDIFNIYGPFSYLFNALLYKVFGINYSVLYNAGIVISFIFTVLLYKLSREFLDKKLSFLISIIIINSLVFAPSLFNSIIPYSYAIVYAMTAFCASVLMLIKYLKSGNTVFSYLAFLFAGISIANKYEFALYTAVLFFVFIVQNKNKPGEIIKHTILFFAPVLLCFLILFGQGLTVTDIRNHNFLISEMINSPTLHTFCVNHGIFPSIKELPLIVFRNGIFSIPAFLPILNIILFIRNFKQICQNKVLMVFALSVICVFIKCLFYMDVTNMGNYIFPFCLILSVVLLKNYYRNFILLLLTAFALVFFVRDYNMVKNHQYKINFPTLSTHVLTREGVGIDFVSDYIITNSKKTDKVWVLPESCIINYITGRKTNNMYHSLLPLYLDDVFGEERVIFDFIEEKPEYVVIFPFNSKEYGKRTFGEDYGQRFYEIITANYALVAKEYNIEIYKRNG